MVENAAKDDRACGAGGVGLAAVLDDGNANGEDTAEPACASRARLCGDSVDIVVCCCIL